MINTGKYMKITNNTEPRRGFSLILFLILIVAIGVLAFYFASEPFSTRVDNAYRDATKWTPENIQEDQTGYLQWAIKASGEQESELKSRALSIRTKLIGLQRDLSSAQDRRARVDRFLSEAKNLYQLAAEDNRWPVWFRGAEITEPELQELIVEAYQEAAQRKILEESLENALVRLEGKLEEVRIGQDRIIGQIRELRLKLEIAQVNELLDDIGEIAVTTREILDGSEAVLSRQETNVTLGDLLEAEEQESRVDPIEFQEIMEGGELSGTSVPGSSTDQKEL